jgi:hypothetical protein
VDAFLLDWISDQPLRRDWFFEKRDGNCRLMAALVEQLSETAPTWRRAVAPWAEWLARTLWSSGVASRARRAPATRLTQSRRRSSQGGEPLPPAKPSPRPQRVCQTCGVPVASGRKYCSGCGVLFAAEQLRESARVGRIAAQGAKAQARRAETQRLNALAQTAWRGAPKQNKFISEETYRTEIQPALSGLGRSTIAAALGVSKGYASDVRRGKRIPHPRHWQTIAKVLRETSTSG